VDERRAGRRPYSRRVWPPAAGQGEEPAAPGPAADEGPPSWDAGSAGGPPLTAPTPPPGPPSTPPSVPSAAQPPVPPSTSRPGPELGEALPPSARWYGTPVEPPRRAPRWARRWAVVLLALVLGAGLLVATTIVTVRVLSPGPDVRRVADGAAGVEYPLPEGWRVEPLVPVTGFTSVATDGTGAFVMARPATVQGELRAGLLDLTDLYARLLLHGDTVDVADDRSVTVGGWPGHTRALRAQYKDVVNRPAYLRVTLVTGPEGRAAVLVGLVQPDDQRRRVQIDAATTDARWTGGPAVPG
jgi:hypothetical protein